MFRPAANKQPLINECALTNEGAVDAVGGGGLQAAEQPRLADFARVGLRICRAAGWTHTCSCDCCSQRVHNVAPFWQQEQESNLPMGSIALQNRLAVSTTQYGSQNRRVAVKYLATKSDAAVEPACQHHDAVLSGGGVAVNDRRRALQLRRRLVQPCLKETRGGKIK